MFDLAALPLDFQLNGGAVAASGNAQTNVTRILTGAQGRIDRLTPLGGRAVRQRAFDLPGAFDSPSQGRQDGARDLGSGLMDLSPDIRVARFDSILRSRAAQQFLITHAA